MSDGILLALDVLLITIVLLPFVGGIGCVWINHYFEKKLEWEAKSIEMQLKLAGLNERETQ